ncbi:hypothetical protein KI387_011756, partial [Taxus chinensis]
VDLIHQLHALVFVVFPGLDAFSLANSHVVPVMRDAKYQLKVTGSEVYDCLALTVLDTSCVLVVTLRNHHHEFVVYSADGDSSGEGAQEMRVTLGFGVPFGAWEDCVTLTNGAPKALARRMK